MFSEVFVCQKGSLGAPSLAGEGGAILSRMLLPLAGGAILSKGRSVKGESMKEGAVNRGAWKVPRRNPLPVSQQAGGTHPTGMHSCRIISRTSKTIINSQTFWWR